METYPSTLLTAENRSFNLSFHSTIAGIQVVKYFPTFVLYLQLKPIVLVYSCRTWNLTFCSLTAYNIPLYPIHSKEPAAFTVGNLRSTHSQKPILSTTLLTRNLPYNPTHSWRPHISFLSTARDLLLSSTPV